MNTTSLWESKHLLTSNDHKHHSWHPKDTIILFQSEDYCVTSDHLQKLFLTVISFSIDFKCVCSRGQGPPPSSMVYRGGNNMLWFIKLDLCVRYWRPKEISNVSWKNTRFIFNDTSSKISKVIIAKVNGKKFAYRNQFFFYTKFSISICTLLLLCQSQIYAITYPLHPCLQE